MLTSYKNNLFKVIDELSFNTANFKKEEVQSTDDLQIILIGSPLRFHCRVSKNSFHLFYGTYVDFEKLYPRIPFGNETSPVSFETALNTFRKWLLHPVTNYLKENQQPDFWDNAKKENYKFFNNKIDFEEDSVFNDTEVEQLKLNLAEAKSLIEEKYSFSENQSSLIENRLKFLEISLKNNSKTVWRDLAIGTFISLILNLSVDTDTGRKLWEILTKAFYSLPFVQLPM